ncbi:sensor domain-containing protein [Mycobacterium simiae]|uniref:Sensor domain-containing protein n=1 Tax=Mycobacterium simiae TaxID=1784 RepID=A0A5B1BLY0_MYCSI|nr:sensor domain-containing protein [Mycobacterium simiae]KAA1248470.1 sensor domain-containing protein [Mycobacterium simiae]
MSPRSSAGSNGKRRAIKHGLAAAVRWAFIACCLVATITACSHSSTTATTSTAPASRVDALIVGVEEVRRIAQYEELTAHAHADLRNPPSGDTNAPGPCRAAGTSDLTFGSGWTEFRSAGYHGITDDLKPGGPALIQTVSQAIAFYPDPSTSRGVLHQLETALQACAALHDPNYEFDLTHPDSSTLKISTNDGWCHLYREKSSFLISVGVLGIEPADQIATSVLQIISDRIR